MESEKVKEIKEALENCTNHYGTDCYHCTYLEKGCNIKLMEDSLTLINELESENERIKDIALNEDITVREWLQENQQLKDRIAFLENDNELLRNAKVVYENVDYCYEDLKKAQDRIAELEKEKTEQLRQFAERLKKKFDHSVSGIIYRTDSIDKKIDETLKEFIK